MKDIDVRSRFIWLLEEGNKELLRARASMQKTGETTTCWLYVIRTSVFFYYGHMTELKDVNDQMLQMSRDYFDMLDIVIPYLHKDDLNLDECNNICQLIDRLIVEVNVIIRRMGEHRK